MFTEHKFACRTHVRHLAGLARRCCAGLASVLAFAFLGSVYPAAQFEKTISTTFDGWRQLPDGSYDLVYGYMNRNTSEVEVQLGPANTVEPAPADRAQPTTFLPGRQRDAFRIHVPKNFTGKLVWTVTYAGTTQTATGSLDQNYSLDVGDPDPPVVAGGPDRTIRLADSVQLSPVVTPAPAPKETGDSPVVARQSRGGRVTVWWSKFRGPGKVSFGDGTAPQAAEGGPTGREFAMGSFRLACTVPLNSTCGATTARFSEPGTYWLRVVAAERSATNAIVKVRVDP